MKKYLFPTIAFICCLVVSSRISAQKNGLEVAPYLEAKGALIQGDSTATNEVSNEDKLYGDQLEQGWQNLTAKKYSESVEHYRRAAELKPDSKDAWLGLQLALLSDKNWTAAAAAGNAALRINPHNLSAISRQAYIRFMQQDYSEAARLYSKALEADPENGEMVLGLGFTHIYLGQAAQGRRLCQKARKLLKDDPRVDECLSIASTYDWVMGAALYGSYFHYTNPWNFKDLYGLAVTASANWPAPFGLWVGTNMTETVLNYEAKNHLQINPVLGVFVKKDGFGAAGSVSWLFSNRKTISNTKVLVLGAGYDKNWLGGGIELSASFYRPFQVFQADPRLRLHLDPKVHLTLGPEFIFLGDGRPGADGEKLSSTIFASIHAGITYYPISILSLFAKGFYAKRSFVVEGSGLSVWTNNDVFKGGYELGAGFDISAGFSVSASLRHDFGAQQNGKNHHFQLVGGTLGLYGRL